MTLLGLRGSWGSGTKPRAGRHSLWGAWCLFLWGVLVIEFVTCLGNTKRAFLSVDGDQELFLCLELTFIHISSESFIEDCEWMRSYTKLVEGSSVQGG